MTYLVPDILSKCRFVYGRVSWRTLLRTLLTDGTSAMILFRLSSFFQRNHLGLLGMIVSKFNYHWNSIVIGQGARFGPGFVILHSLCVVINRRVQGGRNVMIEHGVTIGAEGRRSPVLGDDVFVGAGAKLLGGIRIGNNVNIGANAVVLRDVPDNCTAVGVPARLIPKRANDEQQRNSDFRE